MYNVTINHVHLCLTAQTFMAIKWLSKHIMMKEETTHISEFFSFYIYFLIERFQ